MLSTEDLRCVVEVEHDRSLWGRDYRVTPRLVTEVFGDGKQLVGLEPLDTRPNYYVVRVDSGWDLSNRAGGELFIDHLDDVLEAIELEYGSADDDEDLPCGGCEEASCEDCRARADSWPALDDSCGSSWFRLDWPEEAEAREGVN